MDACVSTRDLGGELFFQAESLKMMRIELAETLSQIYNMVSLIGSTNKEGAMPVCPQEGCGKQPTSDTFINRISSVIGELRYDIDRAKEIRDSLAALARRPSN